ncbi:hypothetical protein MWU75_17720 [Ornithinimicrobium sp. F0845]|uniref:hypothetical protein n=1 Tax=Ornithinimicrobium sp. F0845 TaxID=2926412 RepID=UPI001FF134D4|nr:hypothetical protein [Ornithinimicrobium sp. F0845]MCK0113983.1 hypothetical protein [Ornithinimicrobium sp. F0845]
MSDVFTWRYCDDTGAAIPDLGLAGTAFPTQADAEAWLSDEWHMLADAGVKSVTLLNGDQEVYGPMSLSPADPG